MPLRCLPSPPERNFSSSQKHCPMRSCTDCQPVFPPTQEAAQSNHREVRALVADRCVGKTSAKSFSRSDGLKYLCPVFFSAKSFLKEFFHPEIIPPRYPLQEKPSKHQRIRTVPRCFLQPLQDCGTAHLLYPLLHLLLHPVYGIQPGICLQLPQRDTMAPIENSSSVFLFHSVQDQQRSIAV